MFFVLEHLLNSFSVFLLDSFRSAQNVIWCNEGQNFAALAYTERHLMRTQLKFDTITAWTDENVAESVGFQGSYWVLENEPASNNHSRYLLDIPCTYVVSLFMFRLIKVCVCVLSVMGAKLGLDNGRSIQTVS